MTWAQRLKRVFNIDIETCSDCGCAMKVIACIEDPVVIKQILDHMKNQVETGGTGRSPKAERHRLSCRQGCLTDEPENQRFPPGCCAHVTAAGICRAGVIGNGAVCGKWGVSFQCYWLSLLRIRSGLHGCRESQQ